VCPNRDGSVFSIQNYEAWKDKYLLRIFSIYRCKNETGKVFPDIYMFLFCDSALTVNCIWPVAVAKPKALLSTNVWDHIFSPWLGEIVDNPLPLVDYIPQLGNKNLASGWELNRVPFFQCRQRLAVPCAKVDYIPQPVTKNLASTGWDWTLDIHHRRVLHC
jgi:hypothetical protein